MSNKSNIEKTQVIAELKWTLWDRITMPFYRVRNFFYNKRQRYQRYKRGYSWSDVWDMDAWFISTVKPMLKHLLEKHCGHPCNIENEEWEAILQEMIDCLELMDEDNAKAYIGITDIDYSVELYKKIEELMTEKKDRFFTLFSEWFYNLWD